MNSIRIALLQYAIPDSMEAAALLAETHIRQAASRGAQIICLPELFLTPYFCRTQESTPFALAESIPGPSTERFQTLAKELGVVLILSLFERRGAGVFHNTAVILDADGQQLGLYRKSHIPQDPGFEEKFYFTPGDTGFRAWDTAYGRIAVLICWDQWFPEAARLAALQDARILFYPTAIGSIPQDPPEQQARHLKAWQRVQQGHAVANSCYVATVNRIGMEGTTRFWGHSFVSDYCGEKIAFAGEEESILLAECDQEAMAEHRTLWPYFRDRRPDLYGGLLDVGP